MCDGQFSGAVSASVHTEETNHACQNFLQAFAPPGVPQEVKTDSGPAYTTQKLAKFLMDGGVQTPLLVFPTPPQVKQLLKGHITP